MSSTEYQLFSILTLFQEDLPAGAEKRPEDEAPEGRRSNSIQSQYMPRDNCTLEQAEQEAERRWREYALEGGRTGIPPLNPTHVEPSAVYLRHSEWCLTWFSHWTWDTFADDAAVLDSFRDYVARTEDKNRRERKWVQFDEGGYWRDPVCLMGADDHWRWCSMQPDGSRKPAPCRCDICKKAGIVRVDH